VRCNRKDSAFVSRNGFRETRANDTDTVLAGSDAFDDRDVRETDLALHVLTEVIEGYAALRDDLLDAPAADLDQRPQKYALGAVFTHDIRVDRGRAYSKALCEVYPKTQAVEIRAGAYDPLMPREPACDFH